MILLCQHYIPPLLREREQELCYCRSVRSSVTDSGQLVSLRVDKAKINMVSHDCCNV